LHAYSELKILARVSFREVSVLFPKKCKTKTNQFKKKVFVVKSVLQFRRRNGQWTKFLKTWMSSKTFPVVGRVVSTIFW